MPAPVLRPRQPPVAATYDDPRGGLLMQAMAARYRDRPARGVFSTGTPLLGAVNRVIAEDAPESGDLAAHRCRNVGLAARGVVELPVGTAEIVHGNPERIAKGRGSASHVRECVAFSPAHRELVFPSPFEQCGGPRRITQR